MAAIGWKNSGLQSDPLNAEHLYSHVVPPAIGAAGYGVHLRRRAGTVFSPNEDENSQTSSGVAENPWRFLGKDLGVVHSPAHSHSFAERGYLGLETTVSLRDLQYEIEGSPSSNLMNL